MIIVIGDNWLSTGTIFPKKFKNPLNSVFLGIEPITNNRFMAVMAIALEMTTMYNLHRKVIEAGHRGVIIMGV